MVLGIFGGGGQGREVYEVAEMDNHANAKWDQIVFIDDNLSEGDYLETKLLRLDSALERYGSNIEFVISIGEPSTRKKIYKKLIERGCTLGNVISPDTQISKHAKLGKGLIIKKGVIISPGAYIGDDTTLQAYVTVGHEVQVGEHCQVSTHSVIGGGTKIGDSVFIGLNVPIRELLTVGDGSIISAGAVVLKDVEPNVTVMGNPARVIAKNDENSRAFKNAK